MRKFELLDELPGKESFHLVDKLFEGSVSLSPNRLTKLLADCRSIKVKRLFFSFADRHSPALRQAFIVYLLSHDRPMHEVVDPTRKDIRQDYERGFEGMTDRPVTLDELLEAREALIRGIIGNMPDDQALPDLFRAGRARLAAARLGACVRPPGSPLESAQSGHRRNTASRRVRRTCP